MSQIIVRVRHVGRVLGTRDHLDAIIESGGHRLKEGTRWELHPVRVGKPRSRSTDPDTSAVAAGTVKNPTEAQWRVLTHLARLEPATDEMVVRSVQATCVLCGQEHLGGGVPRDHAHRPHMTPQGVRSRRAELVRLGLVVEVDRDGTTKTGRPAIRWRASRIATNKWPPLRFGQADPDKAPDLQTEAPPHPTEQLALEEGSTNDN